MDIAAIDANAVGGTANDTFVFNNTGVFAGVAGEVIVPTSGVDRVVQADPDGDSVADFAILVQTATPLAATDVIL